MGVIHFMGLGRAIGAVTCAVDYIEKALDLLKATNPPQGVQKLFQRSGGINHQEIDRGKIEALVLFTSPEIINREKEAYAFEGKPNPGQVRDEILEILKKVWRRADPDKGRIVYWCEVDIDNFRDCFDKAIKVFHRFSPPGKQGKEIWCNVTGGSNSIGFALLSAARLTALSTKNYLIAQRKEYQKYVFLPKSVRINPYHDGYFHILPFLKTHIDTPNFYIILMELLNLNRGVSSEEIWSRLRNQMDFLKIDFEKFKREYLLKLFALGYIDHDSTSDLNTITEDGIKFLNELEHLEYALTLEDEILSGNINIIDESKSWSWFQEKDKF